MARGALYLKMLGVGVVCCVGGPALMYYVTPAEGELFKRFNPELQKRNLETRDVRQKNFDDYVTKLKVYAKSDKPIWEAIKEGEAKEKADMEARAREQRRLQTLDASEIQRRKDEVRRAASSPG